MRFNTQLVIAVASLMTAAPAIAQNTADQPADTVNTTGADANIVGAPVPGTATIPDAAATPGAQPATLPPDTDAGTIDTAYTEGRDRDGRFPWGVLGVLGLLGLLGRRRRNRVIGDGTRQ